MQRFSRTVFDGVWQQSIDFDFDSLDAEAAKRAKVGKKWVLANCWIVPGRATASKCDRWAINMQEAWKDLFIGTDKLGSFAGGPASWACGQKQLFP